MMEECFLFSKIVQELCVVEVKPLYIIQQALDRLSSVTPVMPWGHRGCWHSDTRSSYPAL